MSLLSVDCKTCVSIHPETHDIKQLRKLPYFKEDERMFDGILSANTAWFDENEDNIYLLSETKKSR